MAQSRVITMQHVADAVGLTRSAVSLALRKHPSIPRATQERVQAAATRLGYRANPLVSALMSYHLRIKQDSPRLTLGYITSHPPGDPWRKYQALVEMFDGARQRAEELGCALEEFALRGGRMTPARLRGILRARGLRGLLVAPLAGGETVLPLDIADFAVIGLGISVVNPPIMRVATDLYQIGRLMVHRCAELGYRRMGFAASAEMSSRLDHRSLAGFRQGLFDLGLSEAVPPLLPPHTATFAAHIAAWCRREKPDVVVFGTFDEACPASCRPTSDASCCTRMAKADTRAPCRTCEASARSRSSNCSLNYNAMKLARSNRRARI